MIDWVKPATNLTWNQNIVSKTISKSISFFWDTLWLSWKAGICEMMYYMYIYIYCIDTLKYGLFSFPFLETLIRTFLSVRFLHPGVPNGAQERHQF